MELNNSQSITKYTHNQTYVGYDLYIHPIQESLNDVISGCTMLDPSSSMQRPWMSKLLDLTLPMTQHAGCRPMSLTSDIRNQRQQTELPSDDYLADLNAVDVNTRSP